LNQLLINEQNMATKETHVLHKIILKYFEIKRVS